MHAGQAAPYWAHSEGAAGEWDPLRDHLLGVAEKAAFFAAEFDAADLAYNAGLLHDLGKYGRLFQLRLQGKESGIDHWSAGAVAGKEYGDAVTLAIVGHHLGLLNGDPATVRKLTLERVAQRHPQNLRLSEPDCNVAAFRDRMNADELHLRSAQTEASDYLHAAAMMLDVRMLFSALVDADFLVTERHFEGVERAESKPLETGSLLSMLAAHISKVTSESRAAEDINKLRRELRQHCLISAKQPVGLFTLTAPTGTGKTLAVLEFALRHAEANNLRRVVLVAPFLSILDQTADVVRNALGLHTEVHDILLEQHSLAVASNSNDDDRRVHERLAENWDAPLVLTTNVQLLESLFSNRPSGCRKLHRLAKSVIVFDEAQTLPLSIATPTLATLAHLSRAYRASIVFATATQPAFDSLNERVRMFVPCDWKPSEINTSAPAMFGTAARVVYHWPAEEDRIGWPALAQRLIESGESAQALCIVNLKRHAAELFDAIGDNGTRLHLSTAMCPNHRRLVIAEAICRLEAGRACVLVATQCVEAGVDLDFPIVFRALAPLDAIAQAAGRCNRNARVSRGHVHIFVPEDERRYPSRAYEQAANEAWKMRDRDLHCPQTFTDYYRELYSLRGLLRLGSDLEKLETAIQSFQYHEVARLYRVIEQNQVNVLVPWKGGEQLAEQVRQSSLTRDWVRKARLYAVNVRAGVVQDPNTSEFFEPVSLRPGTRARSGATAPDWFLLRNLDHYDERKGLQLPKERTGYYEA
jgi:CRISPR-associated endonuclease/helicase Cas3